ncbi:MAG: histidine phosphatase family protein [Bifidobacterium tibiigranuli]|jgi:2,3-bisphosphoglycerate-dependent phosphoglycerate mutase|uniref:histidine phosphatase family protein n=1 Tax=Bifidobacterium tibiigranuli TaxID=2172043 RepID=UPI0023527875|nr:histidine phosphatase family protein [Bifidobacterium tibiigranuli]MCH3974355.1 histidine phosphatase family protein [Bifidobacterium tibiigranuli]MCH4188918.1 histidine phosphatase family protein [Bifidobacterium tibiigranuli]MCH4203177.1 histidine phosphatase family protein [Bifidobacterium tibiigranuli]MCH4273410.1 histidine phosphatase family protein [Bifidobacterium tibiigranuli]MCI1790524.1 histidine phosphatase family protein [Bifidobacterium tibiigranuli]
MPETQHVRSITLVRHGRTAYNAANLIQGQIDIPLDEVGQWQVRQTAQALQQLYVQPETGADSRFVVSSDLGRARQTAHAFADSLGLEVHTDQRVRERNFGEWEGMSAKELAQQFPEDYRSWVQMTGGELRHGAESKQHVGARGAAALLDWSAEAGENADLFVFSHGAWIAQTLQVMLRLDKVDADFIGVISMRNAHWARLVPCAASDGELRWRLVDYNHGPALADTGQWQHPDLAQR